MSEFKIVQDNYVIRDQDNNIILEAPLMDLYYLIANGTEENPNATNVDRFKNAANKVNEEYGCKLSWGAICDLFDLVNTKVEELKKKPLDTLESLDGTDSILSDLETGNLESLNSISQE